MNKKITGKYTYENNEFIPDKNIQEINKKLRLMKLLAGSTEKTGGSFYFDPINKEYWMCTEMVDYTTVLEQISKSFIEKNYPHVKCDRQLDVDYGDSNDVSKI